MNANLKRALRPYVLIGRRIRRERPGLSKLAFSQPLSYSQFGEDRFLLRYFGDRTGFYVDVGAYDPFHASNTALLYERGWHGINLEPAPDGLFALQRHRRRDVNLPFAASSSTGSAQFSLTGSFAGIIDETRLWGSEGERTTVQTRTLAQILDKFLPIGQQIALLDVDCEGHDEEVLISNDWERFRPQLVLAEAHDDTAGRRLTTAMEHKGIPSLHAAGRHPRVRTYRRG